ncbi:MAG TPA: substrate-binding domain-containing protein [Burkholderiaceae bacterium]
MKPSPVLGRILQCLAAALLAATAGLSCAFGQAQVFNPASWDGPRTGPPKQAAKTVVFVAQDVRNGGITALFRNFENATRQLGWQVRLLDGAGQGDRLRERFGEAIKQKPDAIVLGGFQIDAGLADLSAEARRAGIVLVGWHAAAEPGPTADLFDNVATASGEVAADAANYVIQNSSGEVGVVIINDDRFAVANAKTRQMQEVLAKCKRCRVLAVENVAISNAHKEVPALVHSLNARFGKRWTHTLAINDIYFDDMNFPLMEAGRTDVRNISAGDGSNNAIARIRWGKSQQVATIAEPLGAQGWQLADELNRAFAGQQPSGYVTRPILITTQSLRLFESGTEEVASYRSSYSAIWKVETAVK